MTPVAAIAPSPLLLPLQKAQKPLLEVCNLCIRHGKHRVLHNLFFRVERGELVAIIGRSGAGKSTLMHALAGLHAPESGSAFWAETNSNAALLFQNHRLVPQLSALTNTLTGALGEYHWWQTLLGFPPEQKARAQKWLTAVGLDHKLHAPARKLSGGEQQRVAVARALMQQPSVLLADEPVASLDAETANEVMLLLRSLNEKNGVTVLCVMHDLEMAERFASRVLLLDQGRLVHDGRAHGLQKIVREKLSWKTL